MEEITDREVDCKCFAFTGENFKTSFKFSTVIGRLPIYYYQINSKDIFICDGLIDAFLLMRKHASSCLSLISLTLDKREQTKSAKCIQIRLRN